MNPAATPNFRFPDEIRNLFVVQAGELILGEYAITVAQGLLGEPSPISLDLDTDIDLGLSRPIEVTKHSKVYRFRWESYVAYTVRNESYWQKEPGEPDFSGFFRVRKKSAFMDYVKLTTFASDEYPGELFQFDLDTLNHCISVISTHGPKVTEFTAAQRIELLKRNGWIAN